MRALDPNLTPTAQTRKRVQHDGRDYPLVQDPSGWRLRSRNKKYPADYRTGTHNLTLAKQRARDYLAKNGGTSSARRGGGSLEALAEIYIAAPKRSKGTVARDNVSRFRVICRTVFNRELDAITCREVSPDLWTSYQREALRSLGKEFNLSTRYRENIGINAAIRCARCLFLPVMLRLYRAQGLDVRPDAAEWVRLPEPYVAPSQEDDGGLLTAWSALASADVRLWLTIGLARFAGLRREEIAHARAGWIAGTVASGVKIELRDRPEEHFWTKTGKPYDALCASPELSAWVVTFAAENPKDCLIVSDPPKDGHELDRFRWFERVPQAWLKAQGIKAKKPLHRLRGLYAEHIAKLTSDAVAAHLAGIKAASENLGHTTTAVTQKHYLPPK